MYLQYLEYSKVCTLIAHIILHGMTYKQKLLLSTSVYGHRIMYESCNYVDPELCVEKVQIVYVASELCVGNFIAAGNYMHIIMVFYELMA